MKEVILYAFIVILAIYCTTAVCGYINLGNATKDDILDAYGVNDTLATAGKNIFLDAS